MNSKNCSTPLLIAWLAAFVLALAAPAADTLPRVAPLSPADAAKSFRVQHGFRLTLLAAEPLVMDPVAMEYDENGRAYVVEMSDYPYTDKSTDKPFVERTTDAPIGRVRILEDTDDDGCFDRSTIFAEDLSWPTGVAIWDGGVFVAATPDIWYLKDTDGDRRADVRRRVFTGFKKFNVQAVMNNLKLGMDGWIYGAGSSNGGQIKHAGRPDEPPVGLGRNDFRFHPRTEKFEVISGGARFGNCFDDWGNRFICNIRNPVQHEVLPHRYLARNPFLAVKSAIHDAADAGDTLPVFRTSPPEAWRVINSQRLARDRTLASPRSETVATGYMTSASGATIYRGSAYPPEFLGQVFLGEVAGNLIHRQTLSPDGVTFRAVRADERCEFVTSTDNWFRPVNFVNAPDGTLHVLDMYRETIEHPWSIPDDIKAQLDLESGRDRGRIYRLEPPNFQRPPFLELGAATIEQLCRTLLHANSWQRETAQRLLLERGDKSAAPHLRALLTARATGAGADRNLERAALHALWTLHGLEELSADDLRAALSHPSPHVCEHAVRLAESQLRQSPTLLEIVLALADHNDVRVRFQVALSLGEVSDSRAVAALARIARRDAADSWARTAVLSSVIENGSALLSALWSDPEFAPRETSLPLLRELAAMLGSRNRPAEIEAVLKTIADQPPAFRDSPGVSAKVAQTEVILGLGEGLKRSGQSLSNMTADAASPAAKLVCDRLDSARRLAVDDDATVVARVQAVQLLSHALFADVRQPLDTLLDARQPPALQQAAVRTFAGFAHADVAPLLVAAHRRLTPAVRGEAVEALFARPERIEPLLAALEIRTVSAAQVSATRRVQLLKHADEKLRRRAAALFSIDAPGPRPEVIAQFRPVLSLPADAERGRKVYQRECRTCHRFAAEGYDIGPALESIRNRSPHELLVQILDPNREVSPNFQEYIVTLADGRTATGLIAAETAASLTLRRPEGVQEEILRREIDQIASSGKSLMPEGLEKKLTPQDMADLLNFLLSQ